MTPAEWAELLEMDADGYPNDEAVEALAAVDVQSFEDCAVILETLRAIWRWPSYFKRGSLRGVRHHPDWPSRRLWRVSTGGWSGHEDLLGALERNAMFQSFAARSWSRGGHYVFETQEELHA